jgi:RNA polymerase sigma-32 factor
LGPDERVEDAEFTEVLHAKLEAFGTTLRGRDAQIFRQRLLSDEPMKLAQLAAKFGVSRERARQLEGRLKGRIRAYLQAELKGAFELPVKKGRGDETIGLPMANSQMPGPERTIVSQGF